MTSKTFTDWQKSGRFMSTRTFKESHPKVALLDNCCDIVLYEDGLFIQILKPETYAVEIGNDIVSDRSLNLIESKLWMYSSKNQAK